MPQPVNSSTMTISPFVTDDVLVVAMEEELRLEGVIQKMR